MTEPTHAIDWSERCFRTLLRLFPAGFRRRFGEEMAELFRDQIRAARADGGAAAVLLLWLRTLPAVAGAALLERRDALLHARSSRSDSMLRNLGGDLRFAARMLRRTPLFTVVAVLCIAIGSGAVTTIFSAMNAMVLRPLPGATDAERLVRMERKEPGKPDGSSAAYALYTLLRDETRTLDGVAAWGKASLSIRRGDGAATGVYGNFVSGNFFQVLGVRPALGRFFLPEEDRTELTHPVLVVSHAFWQTQLGADSAVVGTEVVVNGHRFTLVGVAPPQFRGVEAPVQADAWVPIHMYGLLAQASDGVEGDALRDGTAIWLRMAGRLKAGVTPEAANRELSALTERYAATATEWAGLRRYTDMRLSPLIGLPPDASRPLAGFLSLLLGAAALVLLIAGVNVAAMLSARAVARRREMAVRSALGASRGRLVRQLLTEILALFALGAAGGALVAVVATSAMEQMPIPADVPMRLELSPDPRVFAFTLLVSLLTGLVVGLAPARRGARADVAHRLRDGAAGSSVRRTGLGDALVVGQLALSLVLLVGAGLLARALQRGNAIDPGFAARGVVTVPLDAGGWGYDDDRARRFHDLLRERIAQVPGVEAVSFTTIVPGSMQGTGTMVEIDGAGPAHVREMRVEAGYFTTLRQPLRAGRDLLPTDDAAAPKVVVVNETLARRHWPDGDAVGRTMTLDGERVTVVGVAGDAIYHSMRDATPPVAYFPVRQHWITRQTMLVRTSADLRVLAPAVHEAMRALDPDVPRARVMTLTAAMGIGLLPQRVAALVTGVLGAIGLLLATVGLYGIVAYSASRRTREIGIRLALGAHAADVLRMIVREGMRLTAVGVGLGLLLAAAVTRLLGNLLFGVSPLDGVTYVAMSLVFVAVALLASWLPARRAAAADPMVVLRGE